MATHGERTALVEEVVEFLRDTPPFGGLAEQVLGNLAATAVLDFFPKGHRILTQGGPPSQALCVIVSGAVKVSLDPGGDGEVAVDYRAAGDSVGYLSLASGDISRAEVVAAEDTACYLLPRGPFLRVLGEHPAVREYFDRTFLAAYLDRAFDDMRARTLLVGGGERLLFTTPVGDAIARAPVTAPRGISIRAGAGLMSRQRVSSLVLVDPGGEPAGILTDSDLRSRVAAEARATGGPAEAVMSGALVAVEADVPCFEALLTMVRHNIHHLLVTEGGRLAGIVTNHDLMLVQGTSPISVVREIESRRDVAGLAQAAAAIDELVDLLVRGGAKAHNIARIITEIDDRLVRRLAAVVARDIGGSPRPWCWVAHGSPGRRERTFRTAQCSALVHAAPGSEEDADAVRDWLALFAGRMGEGLARCGFPDSPGGLTAADARWRRSLPDWEARLDGWAADPAAGTTPEALGFLDFRPVAGAVGLATQLRSRVTEGFPRAAGFLAGAAAAAARRRPPLGTFGSFVVGQAGGRRKTLDLEASGLGPIVDLARLFALEAGAAETGTVERLRALSSRHPLVADFGADLEQAFEFLALLRITHRVEQRRGGASGDDLVDPDVLGAHERTSLRDAFRLVAKVQDLVRGGRRS